MGTQQGAKDKRWQDRVSTYGHVRPGKQGPRSTHAIHKHCAWAPLPYPTDLKVAACEGVGFTSLSRMLTSANIAQLGIMCACAPAAPMPPAALF